MDIASWFIRKMTHPAIVGWGEGEGSMEEVTFELALEAELHFFQRDARDDSHCTTVKSWLHSPVLRTLQILFIRSSL